MAEDDTIARVMRRDFLRLTLATPIRKAVADLVASGATAAPVVDAGGHLAGIFTQKDCFGPALHSAYYQVWSDTVARYMTREVESLSSDTSLIAAAERFHQHSYRAYPVVQGGRLVGMLDRADLLAAFLDLG